MAEVIKKVSLIHNVQTVTIFVSLLFLSFGAHVIKSSLAVFQVYFIQDKWISTGGYGILLASNTFPCTIFPLFAGHYYDHGNYRLITVSLLLIGLFGQVLFGVAVHSRQFWIACISQILCGITLSCINVVQRAIISTEFKKQKSFAISCVIAVACLAKFLGKAITAPTVELLHSYQATVYFNCIYCLVSLMAGLLFLLLERRPKILRTLSSSFLKSPYTNDVTEENGNMDSSVVNKVAAQDVGYGAIPPSEYSSINTSRTLMIRRTLAALSIPFWCLAAVHATYNTVFHLLNAFLPHLLTDKWDFEIKKAGYVSSLTAVTVIFFAPLFGLFIDKIGYGVLICVLSGISTVVAYYLLLFTNLSPIFGIVVISFSEGIIPTITAALIPSTITTEVYGMGFGIITMLDNIMNFLFDILYGQLYNLTGSYDVGLTVLFAMSVMGALLLISLEYMKILGPTVGLHW